MVAQPTLLVVSQDATVVRTVRDSTPDQPNWRLETCPTVAAADPFLGDADLALVILHLAGPDEGPALALLRRLSGARPDCTALVLADDYRGEQAVACLRAGATEYFGPAQDADSLGHLIGVLTL